MIALRTETITGLVATASHALAAWDVGPAQVRLMSRSENIVLKVDAQSGAEYTLRLHRPGYHTLPELDAEQLWTAHLRDSGLNVPEACRTRDGDYYRLTEVPALGEQRYAGLIRFIEGDILGPEMAKLREAGSRTLETRTRYLREIGRIAARIHNCSSGWVVPAGFERHSFDADGLMGDTPFWEPFWILPQLTARDRNLVLEAKSAIHEALSAYGKHPDRYSMIHADLHEHNVLVSDGVLSVIDFDDAGFGWHQYELAVALYSHEYDPDFPALRDAMIEGYREERAIDDEALALLPLFLFIRSLALLGWMHHREEHNRDDRVLPLIQRVRHQAARWKKGTNPFTLG